MPTLKRFFLFLLFFAIMLLAFVFSINNPQAVPLWLGVELSPQGLGVWMIAAFAVGGFGGLLLGGGLFRGVRYRMKIRQLEKKLKKYEEQFKDSLPAADRNAGRFIRREQE